MPPQSQTCNKSHGSGILLFLETCAWGEMIPYGEAHEYLLVSNTLGIQNSYIMKLISLEFSFIILLPRTIYTSNTKYTI